ncbi:MAG TPA: hypothetical protein VG273_27470 [Bryobacteraceae bacterium]|jgi:serine/threonine-protein kinase|nr:hypothetical protein [Bryobacteraceae bacterium]
MVLPVEPNASPFPLSGPGIFRESVAKFSPDGKYVAYVSTETGRPEIYVRAFIPNSGIQSGPRWMISTQGGNLPSWSADGRKLYWETGGQRGTRVFAADIDISSGLHAGLPVKLFETDEALGGSTLLTKRGQMLFRVPVGQLASEPLNVQVNWRSELKIPSSR